MENIRFKILNELEAMITDFLYYDRKEDDELPVGSIEKALKSGKITIYEITNSFEKKLKEALVE